MAEANVNGRIRRMTAGAARRRTGDQKDSLARDLYECIRARPIWSTLGWSDIRQRYRRSVLGPLWITISIGVLVGTLGVIYSQVLQTDIDSYLPFLCLGFVIWGFISVTLLESCRAFQEGE